VSVVIDSNKVGTLRNAGWLTLEVVPGSHYLKIDPGLLEFPGSAAEHQVTLAAGERKTYRVLPGDLKGLYAFPAAGIPIAATFHPWSIQEVPQEQALVEMRELKRSD
jgi:hypothetical protein